MANQIISGIYKIENTVNGKFYIGSAVNFTKRINKHKSDLGRGVHSNQKLQRAWDKYGVDSFTFSILEVVSDKTKLLESEQRWMDEELPEFNILKVAGSRLGAKMSLETRAKLSASKLGIKMPPFTAQARANMSAVRKGKKRSAETVKKIGAASIGRRHSLETRAKMSAAHFGHTRKKHSEESRKKMSLAARARIISVEQRQKMASSRIGLVQSPESIAKRVATFARKRAERESLCC